MDTISREGQKWEKYGLIKDVKKLKNTGMYYREDILSTTTSQWDLSYVEEANGSSNWQVLTGIRHEGWEGEY